MAAKKRKSPITGLARPEGIIDDIFAPLGKAVIGTSRRRVRRYIKEAGRVANRGAESTASAAERKAYERAKEYYVSKRHLQSGMPRREVAKEAGKIRRGYSTKYDREFRDIIAQERTEVLARKVGRATKRKVREQYRGIR